MGYPVHGLLAFGGPLGDQTGETWSCTLKLWNTLWDSTPTETLQSYLASRLEKYETDVRSFIAGCQLGWNNPARLQWIKANVINSEGRYAGAQTNLRETDFAPPSSQVQPFQMSTVISLQATGARGVGTRGRFYVPGCYAVGATGKMSDGAVKTYLDAAVAFVEALGNDTGTDVPLFSPKVSVVSRGRKLPNGGWGTGVARPVNVVSVDSIPDTQRRRRNQLTGDRQYADVSQ